MMDYLHTYKFDSLPINVLMSSNTGFARVIPCVFATHCLEMENINDVRCVVMSTLIHPCIRRGIQGFQNFVGNSFPSLLYVRIAPAMTSNVEILQPFIQFNLTWQPMAIFICCDMSTRRNLKKTQIIANLISTSLGLALLFLWGVVGHSATAWYIYKNETDYRLINIIIRYILVCVNIFIYRKVSSFNINEHLEQYQSLKSTFSRLC
jgi:hypothetical protein